MTTPRVLFANLPWWDNSGGSLRQGIRAGSRWPFTTAARFLPGQFQFGHYLPAPYFLMSAAGWVQRAIPEAKVVVRDSIARGESYAQFDEYWNANPPTHVILEVGASSWEHDLRYIQAMKHSLPSVKIAVAGPPARELAKTTLEGLVDAWLLGEFEKTATRFVNGECGVIGFDMLTREELKTAPFPMFDEPVALHYFDANPKGQLAPHLQLWGSRGCSYRCCFCAWPGTMTSDDPHGDAFRSVRFYDPLWLEEFIRQRMHNAKLAGSPLRSVYFDDDTGNLSQKHILAVCEVMKRIGLPWSMMCRADTIDKDGWRAMKETGCFGVKLGFESGSQRVIDEIVHKKLNLKEAMETARWLRSELGMTVHGTFTVGLPGERPEEVQQTIAFIRAGYATGGLDSHQLSGTATVPGTPMADMADKDASFIRSADGQQKIEGMMS
jgi:radical SAM superfamily enzyme YgiQ (UPF0313 family)